MLKEEEVEACRYYVLVLFRVLEFLQADREWYNQEEGGMVDETHNPFVGDESKFEQREVELQKKLVPFSTLEVYKNQSLANLYLSRALSGDNQRRH